MREYVSFEDDIDEICRELPSSVWNSIQKSAHYVKECMIFSRYDSVKSIVKLESDDKQKSMFDFVVKMKNAVPDPSSTFGRNNVTCWIKTYFCAIY